MASCGYPYYVGGVFDDRNMLISTPTGVQRDSSYFSKVKDITALVRTEVTAVDRKARAVSTRNLDTGQVESLPYDKLVLATGALPVIPDIKGGQLEGILTLHSMEDAERLKKVAVEHKVKKAVIVGGGLIGIETCEALQLAGVEITIVEMLDPILPFLDWEMAKLVENSMAGQGVKVLTGSAVSEFLGSGGRISGVRLAGGDSIDCDLAVVAIGVRPNGQLAKAAGLEVGRRGGILVNRFMQTNDPDIYAAGDCTEVANLLTHDRQHWPNCKISLRGYGAACCLNSKGYARVRVMEGGLSAWPFGLTKG